MSRFTQDDAGQKAVRDLVIGPGLYGTFAEDGRYIYLDKGRIATLLQKRYAVDTMLQKEDGRAVAIEEKIVRWPGYHYTALTLETKSCTSPGRESDGWMAYGEADWLNYAMCKDDGSVVCFLVPFPKLKEKFWPAIYEFKETITDQINRTACRIVPLDWIAQNVGVFPEGGKALYPSPLGVEAVKAYNGTHYKNGGANG